MGALYFFRGYARARQGEWIRGARDAVRGRKLLVALVEARPDLVDARFWTGAYDYFAATLPRYVRILQTLLFLPRGDRQRGIEGLELVSRDGVLERLEAFVLLGETYGSPAFEDDPGKKLQTLERFHAAYPDSVEAPAWLAWTVGGPPTSDRARRIALHRDLMAPAVAGPPRARAATRAGREEPRRCPPRRRGARSRRGGAASATRDGGP